MPKILLTEDDFKKLTRGEIVSTDGIQLILTDIGWTRMISIIENNWLYKK